MEDSITSGQRHSITADSANFAMAAHDRNHCFGHNILPHQLFDVEFLPCPLCFGAGDPSLAPPSWQAIPTMSRASHFYTDQRASSDGVRKLLDAGSLPEHPGRFFMKL